MKNLSPQSFFDLSDFAHAKIFDGCEFPWEALKRIADYISDFKTHSKPFSAPKGVHVKNPETIIIDKSCTIEPGAFIQGPCILGKNTTVRHCAYIRGNIIAGEGCVIGHTTELKNVILLNHAHAAHFNYVGDSILGNHINLGAGAKIANLKLDGKEIVIKAGEHLIKTGLRKLGVIMGDGVQIGCNAVTNPGTLVGPGSRWFPCVNKGGVFPPNSTIK